MSSSALERVLSVANPGLLPLEFTELDEGSQLVMAAMSAASRAYLILASDDDGDEDGDSDADDSGGGEHSSHSTYKKLVKKGMDAKLAAKMCSKADSKSAAATMLGGALVALNGLDVPDPASFVALAAPPGESAEERRQSAKKGNALPDGSYPIPDAKHLRSAAILAASKHGNYQAARRLIIRRAKELGISLDSLPGFGKSSSDSGSSSEKAAATQAVWDDTLVALAAKAVVPAFMNRHEAFHHEPMSGEHEHPHEVSAVMSRRHFHNDDNRHGYFHAPGH
jgi:hypothetical protein